ncbi:MAG: hypothetical protein JEZ02_20630 [Desulfatibacillum sp.]|nr:hypothetical protein [Desulfatibacillum sp.]
MRPYRFIQIIMALVCGLPCLAGLGHALEVSIPSATVTAGDAITVPVMIDSVDNLAGVKLVIQYDAQVLEFQKAAKGQKAGSLMHVVNSKNPGRVVVVMAGARGIKGEAFPIVTLDFTAKPCSLESCPANLKIVEAQLMSDQLKDLDFSMQSQSVMVVSPKEAAPAETKPEKKSDAS